MQQAFAIRINSLLSIVFCATIAATAQRACAQDLPSRARGQAIVHASCETCHSLAPEQVKLAPSLFGVLNGASPRSTSDAVKLIIQHGRNNRMPAYGDLFGPVELESIVRFLKDLP